MANSVDPDQTAPMGAVCSGTTLFASILNSSVMLGNYLQQTTSADDIFRWVFFLGALRVNKASFFRSTRVVELRLLFSKWRKNRCTNKSKFLKIKKNIF